MGIHVQILDEGEGEEDMVLGVIWSFYWGMYQSRDRRDTPSVVTPENGDGKIPQVIDPGTGLPVSANDLRPKAFSTPGRDLVFGAVVPPAQLARAATYWWKDSWEPGKAKALSYVPRERWTDEMLYAYEENLYRIKRRIHRLAEDHGYFDIRPINDRDPEMSDLDWVGEDRMTIGFRITFSGWEECQRWIAAHPIWDSKRHILDVATEDVKKNAPQWLKDEYRNTVDFEVGTSF